MAALTLYTLHCYRIKIGGQCYTKKTIMTREFPLLCACACLCLFIMYVETNNGVSCI